MAKARTSPATKAAHKRGGCKKTAISFTTKHGKTIEFRGNAGKACGARRKPTPPPKRYRDAFARQARACKGTSHGKFITCMKRLRGSIGA